MNGLVFGPGTYLATSLVLAEPEVVPRTLFPYCLFDLGLSCNLIVLHVHMFQLVAKTVKISKYCNTVL